MSTESFLDIFCSIDCWNCGLQGEKKIQRMRWYTCIWFYFKVTLCLHHFEPRRECSDNSQKRKAPSFLVSRSGEPMSLWFFGVVVWCGGGMVWWWYDVVYVIKDSIEFFGLPHPPRTEC